MIAMLRTCLQCTRTLWDARTVVYKGTYDTCSDPGACDGDFWRTLAGSETFLLLLIGPWLLWLTYTIMALRQGRAVFWSDPGVADVQNCGWPLLLWSVMLMCPVVMCFWFVVCDVEMLLMMCSYSRKWSCDVSTCCVSTSDRCWLSCGVGLWCVSTIWLFMELWCLFVVCSYGGWYELWCFHRRCVHELVVYEVVVFNMWCVGIVMKWEWTLLIVIGK